jgi:hypothetical protein
VEGCTLTVRGPDADRFPDAFVDAKASEAERSLNRRGVRNIHRYRGDGCVHVVYERGAARSDDWVTVTVLYDRVDDRTGTVVVFVGGGGEGPFKLDGLSMDRLLEGEESVGEAGRFATVFADVEDVCDELDLSVETAWRGEREPTTAVDRLADAVLSG